MITPKKPKKYTCEKCDFACSNKKDYNRHLDTKKHKSADLEQIEQEKPQKTPDEYSCECGKEYKARNSLWYHKKICKYKETEIKETENKEPEIPKNLEFTNMIKTLVQPLVEQNKQLMETQQKQQKENQKLQKQLIDAIKDGNGKTINNINNNVNYNINLFLNDQCKDAMNLMDFIDTIKCKLENLEDVGRLGYVDGISKLFIENLSGMELTKRPIHCTDLKRKSLYIKNNDEWSKDNNNTEMRKAISKMANKNIKNIDEWRNKNPEHHNANGSGIKRKQYLDIVNETLDTDDDGKKGDKIIKNISAVVSIDKEMMNSGELEK